MEDELTAVHARREYVDDHQVGAFGANDPQRFLAAPSVKQTMPPVPEQRRNEPQIDGSVLDDKNRGHPPPRFSSDAQGAPFGPSQANGVLNWTIMPPSCVNSGNKNVTESEPKGGEAADPPRPRPRNVDEHPPPDACRTG